MADCEAKKTNKYIVCGTPDYATFDEATKKAAKRCGEYGYDARYVYELVAKVTVPENFTVPHFVEPLLSA